ncbi:MAG: glycosyltransferase family 4 protein [Ignavibacteriae bacterium]|nr:glycosyltransferase family 4 protein [Ignavibacteriota bacterium]
MRIAFVGRYREGDILSGPEKVARRIFQQFQLRPEVHAAFFTYFFDGKTASAARKIVGRTTHQDDAVCTLGLARFASALSAFQPDVLLVATFERFVIFPVLWARLRGIPVLYIVHGVVRRENALWRVNAPWSMRVKDALAEKFVFALASQCVCVSPHIRGLAGREYGIDMNAPVIPNGVDAVFFDTQNFETSRSNSGAVLRIAFAGDVSRVEKGWKFFRDALEMMRNPAEVSLLGPSPRETDRPPVPVTVSDPLPSAALARWLTAHDCFVCASSFESFSIATAEAMAAGLPVIVTEESGISSMINDRGNGILVRYGDVQGLAAALDTLAADPGAREALGRAARMTVSHLAWSDIADRYLEECAALMHRGQRA